MFSSPTKNLAVQGAYAAVSHSCQIDVMADKKRMIYADMRVKEQRAGQDAGAIFTIDGIEEIPDSALEFAAREMNREVADIRDGGSTVCMVMGRLDGDRVRLKTMSAGDSFAELYVLNADGSIALHKILNTLHQTPIDTSYGCLGMNRALGDRDLIRHGLSNEPEIKNYEIQLPAGCSAKVFIYSDAFLPLAKKLAGLMGIEDFIKHDFTDAGLRSAAMAFKLVQLASQHTADDITAVELNIIPTGWTCGIVFDGHRENGHKVSELLARKCLTHILSGINLTAPRESKASTALAFERLEIDPKKIKIVTEEKVSADSKSIKKDEQAGIAHDESTDKHNAGFSCRIM